nr:Sec-independent translocase component C [Cyanidiaceae sp.]
MKDKKTNDLMPMSIYEHLEELRQRSIESIVAFFISTAVSSLNVKTLINLIEQPAVGIKFLQLSPGEYFFTSIKITLYLSVILSSPIIFYELIIFIIPGLTKKERKLLIPVLVTSGCLFLIGLVFGYLYITPIAVQFFINYGKDIIEPIWSFKEYFDFVILSLFSTAISFQIPIFQILLGSLKIISSNAMLSIWRYVIVGSTIFSAIITPSTDPLIQLFLSIAVIFLYFSSIVVLKLFNL